MVVGRRAEPGSVEMSVSLVTVPSVPCPVDSISWLGTRVLPLWGAVPGAVSGESVSSKGSIVVTTKALALLVLSFIFDVSSEPSGTVGSGVLVSFNGFTVVTSEALACLGVLPGCGGDFVPKS